MYFSQVSKEKEGRKIEQIHHKQDHDTGIFLNKSS